jgi:hypothetical protein
VREREGLVPRSEAALLQLQRVATAGGHVKLAPLVLVLCAACAAQKQPVVPAGRSAPPPSSDPHAEIERLSQQIDAQRSQMQLPAPTPAPPETHTPVPMTQAPSWKTDTQCHPGQSQTCADTCVVSDSICGNAKQICDIAATLANDTWAAQKCDEGKATCDQAKQKCCACQP